MRERITSAINVVVFIDGEESLSAGRKVREVLAVRAFRRALRQDPWLTLTGVASDVLYRWFDAESGSRSATAARR